jgi:uncharacterized protein YyaL (SSP411 family)
VFATFVPNKVVLRSGGDVARLAPFTNAQHAIGGRATAYVCTNHLCRLPTGNSAKVREFLGTAAPAR